MLKIDNKADIFLPIIPPDDFRDYDKGQVIPVYVDNYEKNNYTKLIQSLLHHENKTIKSSTKGTDR